MDLPDSAHMTLAPVLFAPFPVGSSHNSERTRVIKAMYVQEVVIRRNSITMFIYYLIILIYLIGIKEF